MKNKLNIILVITLILSGFTQVAEATGKTKVGKINLALVASLHPQMGLLDFQRMGFAKAELGLKHEAFEGRRMLLQMSEELRAAAQKECDAVDAEFELAESRLRSLNEEEGTTFLPDMSERGQKEYEEIRILFDELKIKRKEAEYALMFPEFTTPKETREIFKRIEKEILEAVKAVAKEDGYDVVLNVSMPSPFGYPATYRPEVTYSTGPVGLNQVNYYALLSERPEGREEMADAEILAKKWVSTMFRPTTQDYLPVKPWPLVLSGGEDMLPKVLKKLFDKYEINSVTFQVLMDVLSKEVTNF